MYVYSVETHCYFFCGNTCLTSLYLNGVFCLKIYVHTDTVVIVFMLIKSSRGNPRISLITPKMSVKFYFSTENC